MKRKENIISSSSLYTITLCYTFLLFFFLFVSFVLYLWQDKIWHIWVDQWCEHTGWKPQSTPGAHSKPRKKVYSDITSNHLSRNNWMDWIMRKSNEKQITRNIYYLSLNIWSYLEEEKEEEEAGAFLDESWKVFQKEVPSFWSLTTTITRLQKKNPGSFEGPKLAGANNSRLPMVSSNHQHSIVVSVLAKEVVQLYLTATYSRHI